MIIAFPQPFAFFYFINDGGWRGKWELFFFRATACAAATCSFSGIPCERSIRLAPIAIGDLVRLLCRSKTRLPPSSSLCGCDGGSRRSRKFNKKRKIRGVPFLLLRYDGQRREECVKKKAGQPKRLAHGQPCVMGDGCIRYFFCLFPALEVPRL